MCVTLCDISFSWGPTYFQIKFIAGCLHSVKTDKKTDQSWGVYFQEEDKNEGQKHFFHLSQHIVDTARVF